MNFKDIYKSANDDIYGDRTLIDGIYNKAAGIHNNQFKVRYLYAAAAVVLAISIGLFAKFSFKNEQTGIKVAKNSTAEKSDLQEKENTNFEKDNKLPENENTKLENNLQYSHQNKSTQNTYKSETNIKQTPGVNEQEKSTASNEDVKENSSTETAKISDSALQASVTAEMNINSIHISAKTGGCENAMLYSTDTTQENYDEGLSYDEYCSYIDTDVIKKAVLPNDIAFSPSNEVNIITKNNEIVDDTVYFYAENSSGSKYVSIETSKIFDNADDYLNSKEYNKSRFNKTDAVVIYDGSKYSAYFKFGDVSYSVFACGVSETEFKNLLISLT